MTAAPGHNRPPDDLAIALAAVVEEAGPRFPPPAIDIDEFLRWISYDQTSGAFVWIKARRPDLVGRQPGYLGGKGYRVIEFQSKKMYAHRLAWRIATGRWPRDEIDHIDGDRTNNAVANLREATSKQNKMNAKVRHDNRHGLRGVSFCKIRGAWRARVYVGGKERHLGYFDTKEKAHAKFCEVAMREYGAFAERHLQGGGQ